jgi:TRAP transporter TAXI family solute receptor
MIQFAQLRTSLLSLRDSLRDVLATAWPILLITLIGFVVAYQFVAPAPPRHLTITTGGERGAYYAFAKRYAELLARNGVTLEVKTSAGSYENLARVHQGEADVALVQGGIADTQAQANNERASALKSLGSVYYEPVWVFYRGAQTVDQLHQLAGKRIAVGTEGSGIRGLALQLLAANQIAADSPFLLPLSGTAAVDALQQGTIDAAFLVAAPEAPVVQTLLRSPDVRVMSFSQADAYTYRFPFLSKIVLPQSVFDLVHSNPPQDTVLLATTANLIIDRNLHPALASLLLQVASEVHGQSGFFQRADEFPKYKDHSFALSEDA